MPLSLSLDQPLTDPVNHNRVPRREHHPDRKDGELWAQLRLASARVRAAMAATSSALVVLAAALAAVGPAILVRGIVATRAAGDSPFLLQRVHQYAYALGAGHFPVRWMPDAAYGLGYPFWNYYAPLAYLFASPIALVGGGVVVGAIKVTMLVAFLAAAWGAYRLGSRHWGSRAAGVVVAASYTFAPYHLVNLYVRGDALSELVAYAAFPWVLLAVESARASRTAGAVAGLAVALAALLLSHNISALLFAPVLAAYLLWRLVPLRSVGPWLRRAISAAPRSEGPLTGAPIPRGVPRWAHVPGLFRRISDTVEAAGWRWRPPRAARAAAAVGAACTLGILLAAWFWVPALAERDAVQLESNVSGYFRHDAQDGEGQLIHFRGVDLVQRTLKVDYAVTSGCDPCRNGLAQVLVAAAGVVAAVWVVARSLRRGPSADDGNRSPSWHAGMLVFWIAVAGATTLMITPLSVPLWESLPLLGFAQFPWRWLAVQALALAMVSGGLGLLWPRGLFALLATAGLGAAAMAALPVETLPVGTVRTADITAFELFTGNIGTTVRAEYLPRGVDPRPWSGPLVTGGAAGEAKARAGALNSAVLWGDTAAEQTWDIDVTGSMTATVALPVYFFPGWSATITPAGGVEDGRPRPSRVSQTDGSGWLAVEVPPGRWSVRLQLGRTVVRAIAEALSLLGLVVVGALVTADRRRRWWHIALGAVVGFAVFVAAARAMPVGPSSGPVAVDSVRLPYPHRNPGGIGYGGSRLTTGVLSPSELEAGQPLTVRLEWSGAWAGSIVQVALVSPAEPVYQVPDIVSRSEAPQESANHFALTVPEDVPSGLYFVRLRVTNNDRRLEASGADGHRLGEVYLGPVKVMGRATFREMPDEALARMGEANLYAAQAAQVDGDPHLLEVRMYWQSVRPMLVDYKTSVRLLDAEGENLAQDDKMPRYGFYPTTAWPAGEQVLDIRWLELPDDLETRDDYMVEVVMYESATDRVLGRARVRGVRIVEPEALR